MLPLLGHRASSFLINSLDEPNGPRFLSSLLSAILNIVICLLLLIVNMRFLLFASALASLATSAVANPAAESPITYEGYKVYRIETNGNTDALKEKLSGFKYDEWNNDAGNLDIALSPDQEGAFKSLALDFKVLHQDLGVSIKTESAVSKRSEAPWKRQAEDLSWYNEYHTYGDHIK